MKKYLILEIPRLICPRLQSVNFESCVWRAVSSHSSHHPQEVLMAQFSLYVHKGSLKPVHFFSFHFISFHLKPECQSGGRSQTFQAGSFNQYTRTLAHMVAIMCPAVYAAPFFSDCSESFFMCPVGFMRLPHAFVARGVIIRVCFRRNLCNPPIDLMEEGIRYALDVCVCRTNGKAAVCGYRILCENHRTYGMTITVCCLTSGVHSPVKA